VGGLKFLPIGSGVIDHRQALAELMSMDYDGYLSGEWIGWDRPNYLAEELSTMRRYEEALTCTR
ncbi:MAG: hypothetical protein IKS52_06865, partial [Clostridia bacterium]|nr:hypothetical protein [Clostridia bacterium]